MKHLILLLLILSTSAQAFDSADTGEFDSAGFNASVYIVTQEDINDCKEEVLIQHEEEEERDILEMQAECETDY